MGDGETGGLDHGRGSWDRAGGRPSPGSIRLVRRHLLSVQSVRRSRDRRGDPEGGGPGVGGQGRRLATRGRLGPDPSGGEILGTDWCPHQLRRTLPPHGITVDAVSPGFVASGSAPAEELKAMEKKIPAGYVGTVDDAVAVAGFLLSDKARYVNGANIHLSGAWGI